MGGRICGLLASVRWNRAFYVDLSNRATGNFDYRCYHNVTQKLPNIVFLQYNADIICERLFCLSLSYAGEPTVGHS